MTLKIQSKFFVPLLFLIPLVFLFPMLGNNFYFSHDGEANVARFGAYIKGFLDGQFPIRWAGDLNYGYGSPVLNFYYPLPGLISIPLHLVGLSLENIFKLIISLSFIFSFISFYLWSKEFLRKEPAFLAALIYGLSPYHFLNLFVRGDVAELLALSFVPLVFLFIDKTLKDSKNFVPGAIVYSLVILSHNSIALIFSPIFLAYAIIKSGGLNKLKFVFFLFTFGLMMSSFFWLPALLELKFTNAHLFIGDNFKDHFLSFNKIIFSNWGFGPDVNKPGGLSPHIGILNSAIILLTLPYLLKRKDKILFFWLLVFLISVFLTLSISTPVWNRLDTLKFLEFPWRILALSSFAVAVIGGLLFNNVSKKWIAVLSIFLILWSGIYIKINQTPAKPDSFYFNYEGTTYYHGEASSVWTAGDFSRLPGSEIEILSGEGKIVKIIRKSNLHKITTSAVVDLRLLDNTVYFPGWKVLVDNREVPIEFQDTNHRGLITFKVPRGNHDVSIKFEETKLREISDILSAIALLIILGISSRKLIFRNDN